MAKTTPTGCSGPTSTPSTPLATLLSRPSATYAPLPRNTSFSRNALSNPAPQGPKAAKYADLFEFFETVIDYYKDLPTWRWLADAGINPSNTTSYTLSDIQGAIKKGYGKVPYIGCGGPRYNETDAGKGSSDNGRTQLQEMWYYSHVNGRVQNKDVVRVDADVVGGSLGSCAKAENAVWYYKRAKGSETNNCHKK